MQSIVRENHEFIKFSDIFLPFEISKIYPKKILFKTRLPFQCRPFAQNVVVHLCLGKDKTLRNVSNILLQKYIKYFSFYIFGNVLKISNGKTLSEKLLAKSYNFRQHVKLLIAVVVIRY